MALEIRTEAGTELDNLEDLYPLSPMQLDGRVDSCWQRILVSALQANRPLTANALGVLPAHYGYQDPRALLKLTLKLKTHTVLAPKSIACPLLSFTVKVWEARHRMKNNRLGWKKPVTGGIEIHRIQVRTLRCEDEPNVTFSP